MDAIPNPEISRNSVAKKMPWKLAAALAATLAMTVAVHCATLTISPRPWTDECQILDYGRTLYPDSDQSYAATWSVANKPVYPLAYVGCLIQETAYRMAGRSMAGPRLAAMLGAALAAVAMHLWLTAAGITPWIAFVATCSFLWDPLFVQGYRGARVDGWCIGFMLLALVFVRKSTAAERQWPFVLSIGACLAVSGLTWPSAILLVPLLLHEMYVAAGSASDAAATRSLAVTGFTAARFALVAGGAAMACIAVLLLPFFDEIRGMVSDLASGVGSNTANQTTSMASKLCRLPPLFERTPWLPLAALLGVGWFGPRSWLVAFAAAAAGVALSRPYEHRAVYLIPYFVYGFAAAADRAWTARRTWRWTKIAVTCASVVLLVWSAGMSLVARTAVALRERETRDPRLLEHIVDEITQGERGTVLLGSWSLYYPFRARGWAFWGPGDARTLAEITESLDYDVVVHEERTGTHPLDRQLRQQGYSRRVVRADGGDPPAMSESGFGPYVVYCHPSFPRREKPP